MGVTTIVAPLVLLFIDRRFVQTFVDRSVEKGAAARICQIFLLLHDGARPLRNERLLLDLARSSPIFKPFIHLGLPAAVIVRIRHV